MLHAGGDNTADSRSRQTSRTYSFLLKAHILVFVALPETGFEPFQPCLTLLGGSGEPVGGHLVGYGGENGPGSVDPSELLLQLVLTPRVDERQRLQLSPRNASSPFSEKQTKTIIYEREENRGGDSMKQMFTSHQFPVDLFAQETASRCCRPETRLPPLRRPRRR